MAQRSRESFPDDASWIAYQQHEAMLAAEETRKRIEASHRQQEKQRKPKIKRRKGQTKGQAYYASLTRSERVLAQIRSKDWRATWKAEDPEGYVAYWHAVHRRWFESDPEHARALHRQSWWRHREKNLMAMSVYRRDHADELAAKECARRAANNPNYRNQNEISADARELEQQVASLHAEGWTFTEIAKLLGRPRSSCTTALTRASKLAQKPVFYRRDEISAAARAFEQQLLLLRTEGWTWSEMAELTGHSAGSCKFTYYRAKRRAQQQQSA